MFGNILYKRKEDILDLKKKLFNGYLFLRAGTDTIDYHSLYSLSVFSLAKSLRLILEISATYRLVSYLLADN